MNNLKSILLVAIFAFIVISCDKEKDMPIPPPETISPKTIENLYAPISGGQGQAGSGEFTKFSFAKGETVTGDDWDIAFRSTTIIVNGGAKVGLNDEPERKGNASLSLQQGVFSAIKVAPADSEFKQDAKDKLALTKGSGNGWYTYDYKKHTINPIPGKVLVVKTHNGHYAKMEILSYYKDKDVSNPQNGRYYTFNYVYNSNVGDKKIQ